MFAAACGVHARDDAQARRALLPIAIGHAASVAIVVCALAQGLWMDRAWVQRVAGALLIGVALHRGWRGAAANTAGAGLAERFRIRTPTGHVGIALWSCLMATAHGAGLMLVPALVPICMSGTPAREITASGSAVLGLAAVGLHLAAMLVTTGAIATGVCRGIALRPEWMRGRRPVRAWTAVLAVTGVVLMLRAG
ncbi:hypothetical protein [Lysobacter capsici]|uniref:hypothetical protein n=1 Tax=Lysobacter capsici TaxID=435897 RepID=UPI001BFFFBE1|nr:hypothetical protein [Lysobacter capsici]QWF15157.1 hypothetical protein KME82_15260 [Lysobacter capsici]